MGEGFNWIGEEDKEINKKKNSSAFMFMLCCASSNPSPQKHSYLMLCELDKF